MRREELEPREVVHVPSEKEEGVLYVSDEFELCVHLCACGCGRQSVTPFFEGEWTLTREDGRFTLSPSILNRTCGAHYFVRDNRIVWC